MPRPSDKSDSIAAAVIYPDWSVPARVRAAVTTRALSGASKVPFDRFNLGAHCGDDARAVASNRAALVSLLSLPASPCWMRQVHGAEVAIFDATRLDTTPVDAAHIGAEAPVADAAITRTPGVVLAVLTADCLPLLVCADDGSEVAAIHAGWRGLAAGVVERCIEKFHAPREGLRIWLGPAIGPRSYEVGEEVRDAFLAHDARAIDAFTATRPAHWLCDLYTLARLRLAALGVSRVSGGAFDTLADARFYSHRRDNTSGRFASLIWLAE